MSKGYDRRIPSPKGSRRACLCKDGATYSTKCCDGSFEAQGIGNVTRTGFFLLTENNKIIIQENNSKLFQ